MKRFNEFPVPEVSAFLVGSLLWIAAACAHADTLVEKPAGKDGYRFETALSIGGPDAGDEAYFYERYGSVDVDAASDGSVYVLDNGNVRIQVFDAKGDWKRSLGAEGEGPGEFRMMAGFSVNAAGDVAVLDMGQGRVTVLDSNGGLLYDVAGNFGVEDLLLLDDRTVLVSYGKVGPAKVEAYGPDGKRRWQAGAGSAPHGGRQVNIQLDRQTIAPRLVAFAGGRVARAPVGEYRLETYGADGAEGAVYVRPFERRKISEEDMAPPQNADGEEAEPVVIMIRQDAGGAHGGGGDGGGDGGKRQWTAGDDGGEEMHIDMDDIRSFMPEFHPDTRGLLAWPDGRVWVVTAEDGRAGTVTDEWSADGQWARRFSIPEVYDEMRVGRDGRLYGVTHDDDGYPTVHRLDVDRS